MPNPKLSIVLPAYDGADVLERHLPTLQRYLRQLRVTWEIVVADDGSDDAGATS